MVQQMNSKEKLKLTNQSLVYEAMGDDQKLTIREILYQVNSRRDETDQLSEQTIRRAVTDLCKLGQLKPFGKAANGAQTYGKLSAHFTGDPKDKLIPFGGNLVGVEDFIKLIADPETRPLKKNSNVLAEKSQHNIRRMMLFAILSAGEAGQNEALNTVHAQLHNAVQELTYARDIINHYVNSSIWFPAYRDKLALSVRNVIKNDPELYQLAQDYMKSE